MPKQKILFLIDSLNCGGAEKSLVSLLSLLDYTQLDVTLMLRTRGGIFEQLVPEEVKIVDFPKVELPLPKRLEYSIKIRTNGKVGKKRHLAEIYWDCFGKYMPKLTESFDVAIAYQQGFPTYYMASCVDAKMKFAWVNIDLQGANYSETFNKTFYSSFDRVVAVSESLYNNLLTQNHFDSSKLTTIYDILNPLLIDKMSKSDAIKTDSYEDITLTTVGRMVYQKNYTLAVETAKILKDKGINFRWFFVGGGDEESKIKELVKRYDLQDNIIVTGMQPNPYPYIAACDIYVQTSLFEGFGLTIAEAKILNKPIVSTNFSVVYDQITDGVNGLIADMNADSMAEKILTLINDRELRQRIVDNVTKEENTTYLTEVEKFERLLTVDG